VKHVYRNIPLRFLAIVIVFVLSINGCSKTEKADEQDTASDTKGETATEALNLEELLALEVEESRAKVGNKDGLPLVSAAHGKGYEYVGGIIPLLEHYCIDCHDAEENKGDLNLEKYLTAAKAEMEPDLWDHIAVLIDMEEMPPRKKKKQPTLKERERIIRYAKTLDARWDSGEMGKDPGHTTIRRLNKNEYNYTIRDLFGIYIWPANNFPEDSGGDAGFDNNADALFLPSLLMENYVEASGKIVQAIYDNHKIKLKYLFTGPIGTDNPAVSAEKILKFWSSRAYRRPVRIDELRRLLEIFEHETKKGTEFSEAMKIPLLAILLSPNFLYRAEHKNFNPRPHRLDQFDFATRLSYFLWSSMPDQELFKIALDGKLNDPDILKAQVLRMLKNDKAKPLSTHFAGQWFGWEELRSRANPDKKKFPEFDFKLRVLLYRESSEFFHNLIVNDISAYDLLHCDYAFLNERLAKHYGIRGVKGPELRKVKLSNPNRGGVLGMGSVLIANSTPLRTSPVIRGAYVLDQILGTPPPDPPMNVPILPEDERDIQTETFRETLLLHRENRDCAACHNLIDPVGFGLENFDAIGRWRVLQNDHYIDTKGHFPDGQTFSSPAELKQLLLKKKDVFARNMVSKLLSYAIGRSLNRYDRHIISKITDDVIADNGSIHTAILGIVNSYPFQYRRGSRIHVLPQ